MPNQCASGPANALPIGMPRNDVRVSQLSTVQRERPGERACARTAVPTGLSELGSRVGRSNETLIVVFVGCGGRR